MVLTFLSGSSDYILFFRRSKRLMGKDMQETLLIGDFLQTYLSSNLRCLLSGIGEIFALIVPTRNNVIEIRGAY
jgi:hypothetical protein